MSSGVFLLQKDGSLVEMNQKDYDSEDLLQSLLAKYPNLLAGKQIDELNPRKWLLVSREISVPDEETSDGRWSVDHLFLDQDGVPTLVEVKRSSDTRIRREVVGQMLEYAANAASYWNIDKIRSHYEATCEKSKIDPRQLWVESLALEEGYDEFWEKVGDNLETGHLRLLFVADEIPYELKTIVEFLNEQMSPSEVLALEIKQYVGENQKTLIPMIFGQTSKIQAKKGGFAREKKQWDEASFLTEVAEKNGQEAADVSKRIVDWAAAKGMRLWWGKGSRSGSFFPMIDHLGQQYWSFAVVTYGKIEFQFQMMKSRPPYDRPELRRALIEKLNRIDGVSIPPDAIDRRPSIPILALAKANSLQEFFGVWGEYVDAIRSSG